MDEPTEFDYYYSRDQYPLTVQNREYLTNASSADGNYYYEAQIILSAIDRDGYTFNGWSNGLTDQTLQFTMDDDLNTAVGIAVLLELVKEVNKAKEQDNEKLGYIRKIFDDIHNTPPKWW